MRKEWILTYINLWRAAPAYLCFQHNKFKKECGMDLQEWIKYEPRVQGKSRFLQFAYLMVNEKSCRNILHNRLHRNPLRFLVTYVLLPPMRELYINMPPEKLGGGLSFQHGFSTMIAARQIGERCRINQQVAIGYKGDQTPVIGNDVTVAVGAIVIGGLNIEDGAVIGAGAVVTHDVPKNAVVVGVPAKVVKILDK